MFHFINGWLCLALSYVCLIQLPYDTPVSFHVASLHSSWVHIFTMLRKYNSY